MDGETGEMVVERVKTVVEELDDPDIEISLDEAQIEFGDAEAVGGRREFAQAPQRRRRHHLQLRAPADRIAAGVPLALEYDL